MLDLFILYRSKLLRVYANVTNVCFTIIILNTVSPNPADEYHNSVGKF